MNDAFGVRRSLANTLCVTGAITFGLRGVQGRENALKPVNGWGKRKGENVGPQVVSGSSSGIRRNFGTAGKSRKV